MHRFSFVVLLVAVACDDPPAGECTTRDDCPTGLSCVNNECRSLEPAADAGSDAGGSDAGADAGSDAGVDGGPTCTCGDVDVDGDGDVDDTDLAALPALSASDECVLEAADADLDGDYDAEDEHALRALASGAASGACEACGDCADVDGDGDVDADDATAAAAIVEGTPSPCELLAIDVNRDGAVELLDAWLVAGIAEGRVTAECAACAEGRLCGDYNDDGEVNVSDGSGLVAPIETALSPCTHIASDVVRDGVIDRRDGHGAFWVITQDLLGRTEHGGCAPCLGNGMCGDVNDDGMLGSGDAIVIGNIGMDGEATVCERALADLNADGQINVRDSNLVIAMRLGGVAPVARCPICTGVCGDVNQDGGTSGGDQVRFAAIDEGTDVATVCEWDAANLDGDVDIDARDQRLLTLGTVGSISTTGPCRACSGVCGDANNDGEVTAADRSVVTEIEGGRLPTPCEMDNGDVDFDNDVDAADRDLITDIIAGTPPSMPCGR